MSSLKEAGGCSRRMVLRRRHAPRYGDDSSAIRRSDKRANLGETRPDGQGFVSSPEQRIFKPVEPWGLIANRRGEA